ncbi:hypothetical protein T484DRAFT_1943754 [Baffinella frigidus]|nr:hypothetical protein T484DRAFT_1943754 [Cryptophyta sp. CCMP2293]
MPHGQGASSGRGQCAGAPERLSEEDWGTELVTTPWHLAECSPRWEPGCFSQVASTRSTESTRSSETRVRGSSVPSTRWTSASSRAPSALPSDLQMLLYAAFPARSTHPQESPPSLSKGVLEWERGRDERKMAAMRPLSQASIVNWYFRAELRMLPSSHRSACSWDSPISTQGGSAPVSPLSKSTAWNPRQVPAILYLGIAACEGGGGA